MLNLLLFLLLMSIIICIHEAGHLLAAKIFGVYCYEFSFGMGPKILSFKGNETQYNVRAFPVGGFVAMAGEEEESPYPDVEVPEDRRLSSVATWKRILVMLAGVFMNLILGWFIFSMVMLNAGGYQDTAKNVLSEVVANSPAERAGLEAGDIVTKITSEDGSISKISNFTDISLFLTTVPEQTLTFEVQRDGEPMEFTVVPDYDETKKTSVVGIAALSGDYHKINLLNCWHYGMVEVGVFAKLMIQTIGNLIRGAGLNQLSGPVGIYQATSESVSYGPVVYFFLVAELSLNIGIFNLLPLPVLDGGQVIVILIEKLIGHKISEKVKVAIMVACWVLLIGVMLFATFNDISRIIS